MFQFEDEEYDLSEEFLGDIFQLTGPQKSIENGNSAKKAPENCGEEFPLSEKKNVIVRDRTYRHSSSSNSSPVSKKARFPCDSDQGLLPVEPEFLDFKGDGHLVSTPKNSGLFLKDTGSDFINSQKCFGAVNTDSTESVRFSPRIGAVGGENINRYDFSISSSNVRRRKFPGPAGLLPELGEPVTTLSQPCAVGSLFDNNSPWASLRQDMGLSSPDSHRSPLSKICLKWARQKASARQLPAHKVPFLAVAIHALDCSSPDPCVILRDPTGEMGGTLHRDVWERYGYLLHPGAALALRQVGVLSTGAAARRHYLNITENNLLSIYSSGKVESGLLNLKGRDEGFSSEVKITKIRPLDLNEVKRSLAEMQSICQSPNPATASPPTMHSSVSTGPRFHTPLSNSARPAPYRAPYPNNTNRFSYPRPANPSSSGQLFTSNFRNPSMPNQASFISSPMQSSTWGQGNNTPMEVQCSSTPPSQQAASSPFTPKIPTSIPSAGSFVPKQPFLNKFQRGQFGSSSVPYHSSSLGITSLNNPISSQECATAMDVSIGPDCDKPRLMSHSESVLESKREASIAGAECRKAQTIEEAELDSILGGIDTDLLFDDDF
ncbi:hypothetical protein J437_LFUL005012 [Ladona fulva]|uniref:Homologous recombination OB-fold protein OB-fold domain-containing protein n=1 Tax=Ladona fulva TaxID=123851 RepID=A0A8K0JUT8_LADFU|nr:hypothetical protein J437_LFUL005012 [Ladona fulva]